MATGSFLIMHMKISESIYNHAPPFVIFCSRFDLKIIHAKISPSLAFLLENQEKGRDARFAKFQQGFHNSPSIRSNFSVHILSSGSEKLKVNLKTAMEAGFGEMNPKTLKDFCFQEISNDLARTFTVDNLLFKV